MSLDAARSAIYVMTIYDTHQEQQQQLPAIYLKVATILATGYLILFFFLLCFSYPSVNKFLPNRCNCLTLFRVLSSPGPNGYADMTCLTLTCVLSYGNSFDFPEIQRAAFEHVLPVVGPTKKGNLVKM